MQNKIDKLKQKMIDLGYVIKSRNSDKESISDIIPIISMSALARAAHIRRDTIARIFNGQGYKCDGISIIKFCIALGIGIYDLPFDEKGIDKIYFK